MSRCVRCESEVKFLDGFITTRGMVCPRCREVESLRKDLASLLAESAVISTLDRLTASNAPLDKARRLADLDESCTNLRAALAARAIEQSEPALFPPDILEAARVALFERSPAPAHIEALVAIGCGDRAAQLLEAHPPEVTDAWIEALTALSRSGLASRALAIALAMRGAPGSALLDLIATTSSPADIEQVAVWIGKARLASVEHAAAFHGAIKARTIEGALPESAPGIVLNALRTRWKSTADELVLLLAAGESKDLEAALESIDVISADFIAVLDRFMRTGLAAPVLSLLERSAQPGPTSAAISSLAGSIASIHPELRDRAALVSERCGDWIASSVLLGPVADSQIRARCRKAMDENDSERLGRIGSALEQAQRGRYREARTSLAALRDLAPRISPLASLSAAAQLLLLEAALHEALVMLEPELSLLAKRRHGRRKPLKDEGSIARLLPVQRDTLLSSARRYLEFDSTPHWPLIVPRGFDRSLHAAAVTADAGRGPLLEQAANMQEIDRITEASILEPAFIRILGELTISATGIDTPPEGETLLDRASFLALVARRLNAPADPRVEASPRVAPRELVAEFALRSYAFRPRETKHDTARWGDFVQLMGGMLRTLGYGANGVRIIDETWPTWTSRSCPERPGRNWLSSSILPPLDECPPLRIEEFYTDVDIDLSRAEKPLGWRS